MHVLYNGYLYLTSFYYYYYNTGLSLSVPASRFLNNAC